MALASPAPCPFMGALRTGWQGPEVPKVSGGNGLAQSHPGGRGPSSLRPLASLKHSIRGAGLVPEEARPGRVPGLQSRMAPLLNLKPTSALKESRCRSAGRTAVSLAL